jgi:hypothetical protein
MMQEITDAVKKRYVSADSYAYFFSLAVSEILAGNLLIAKSHVHIGLKLKYTLQDVISQHELFENNISKIDFEKTRVKVRESMLKETSLCTSTNGAIKFVALAVKALNQCKCLDAIVATLERTRQCTNCGAESTVMKKCERCKLSFYCDRKCQMENWRRHKQACENYVRRRAVENNS